MKMHPKQKQAYVIASEELGTREIRGAQDNPRIVEYAAKVGHSWVEDDETPWCASFVGWALEESGLPSTRKLNARSYLEWGEAVDLKDAKAGDIVVFWRGSPSSWQGHVGFYVDHSAADVTVLGGNQSNAVTMAPYGMDRLLGVRRYPAPMQTPTEPHVEPPAPKPPGGGLAGFLAALFAFFMRPSKKPVQKLGPQGFVPVPHEGRTIWVMPDFYKRNGIRMPVTGIDALRIAQERSRALGLPLTPPTKEMVDSIHKAADVRLNPHPLNPDNTGNAQFWQGGPGGMTDPKWYKFHNDIIERQLAGRGGLIDGHKKTILRDAAPGKVRIYGWHDRDGEAIQSDSNRHVASYTDYSHGLRLVYDPEGE
jgi:uncharacterized protein (TIGR02594 family)